MNVRKAMAQAIDKADLYATVFPGYPDPNEAACANATPSNYWRSPYVECLGVRRHGGQQGAR